MRRGALLLLLLVAGFAGAGAPPLQMSSSSLGAGTPSSPQVQDSIVGHHAYFERVYGTNIVGVACDLDGIVTHVSALRPRLIVFTDPKWPYRTGILVSLAPSLAMPAEGDEVRIEGRVAEEGNVRVVKAEKCTVTKRGDDLAPATRFVRPPDLRKGLLDFRRQALMGRVIDVNGNEILVSLPYSMNILVRVPRTFDARDALGRFVQVTGCVFPLYDYSGKKTGSALEVSDPKDFVFLDSRLSRKVKALLWGIAAVLALLAILGLVLYLRHRRDKRLIAVERQRMARDLHDTIGQYLAGVRILVTGALRRKDIPPDVVEPLRRACAVIEKARVEVREQVLDLRNDAQLARSLGAAIRALADELNDSGSCRVEVRGDAFAEGFQPGVNHDILSIVREAAANAIAHGGAKRIVIAGEKGVLKVQSDGAPFDPAQAAGPESGHFGLSNMSERATRAGVKLAWASEGDLFGLVIARP